MKGLIAFLLVMSISMAAAGSPPASLVQTTVSAEGLVGKLYRPAGVQDRLPSVIVLGGSEGGLNPAVSREARLIARRGYVALQLAYFGAPRLPETLQLIPVDYFERAVDWLGKQPGDDPRHIGIVGTSIGGEAALLVAAYDPAITAVMAAVPSGVVWPGIADGIARSPPSSFTLGGRPLPDLPYGWGGATGDVYQRYAGGLRGLPRHRNAIIPVERINGAVMLMCGERDRVWPSCPMTVAAAARLRARAFSHPLQVLDFQRAGHAVFGPPVDPSSADYAGLGSLGGSAAANDAARRTDWPAFLAFLDSALKPADIAMPVGLSQPVTAPRDH
jgi:dienelactone hydrolase